ncbi:MAG TPA: GNAT family N-acetyltransferase [Rugosimonospora sp.]|nr:GNAT family N-acetyltransferase [Rugosimonospora sp.]
MPAGSDVLLSDGTTVHIRPIRPQDADSIVAMHARFSERTRYLRYFSPYPRIPERDLIRFVNVDHHDREALVIQVGDRLIAVGRYDRLGPEAEEAEVAFVVEDVYQGKGIGSILLEHLAAAAREAGLVRFVAEVLPVNGPMLRVFADAGYQVQRQYADGVVHLTFPIAPTEESLAVQWRREQVTEARSIGRLLAPRGVAVYGVRRDGNGIGAALLRHLSDFSGPVYPIHRAASTLAGRTTYQKLVEAPGGADLAVVAVPADAVASTVEDAAAAGVAGLVVVSSGFAEAGPAGTAAQDDLRRACRAAGMRLVGPNCLGIANTDPQVRLNATLAGELPARGRVGFFSQSGALGTALLAEARRRGLGLSSFVSAGNRADVSGNDLLQYWQSDPATDVVLLYLETFGNPRKFARLARRLGREKPIVAVASQFRPPGLAALPAGPDPVGVAALFAQSGVIRVDTVAEMFDVGVLLAHQPLPAGMRVGIVTNSSALGVLAAGACGSAGLAVVDGYPADVGPQATPEEFASALSGAVADERVDALIVVCAPPLPPEESSTMDGGFEAAVAGAARHGDKPVVATFLAGTLPPGVPSYDSVEEAVRALGRVARYAHWRRTPAGRVPELSGVDSDAARTAGTAEELLAAYGVPVLASRLVTGADAAVAAAGELGYPVVVKVADPALRHRVDLGAVRLDLAGPADVRRACAELDRLFTAGTALVVQAQVAPGTSWVVEAVEDPAFGPIVGFGPGGVIGELVGDRAWRAAPLTRRDAAALVREPKAAPLLSGHRGAEPAEVDAVIDLLLRVGRLADEQTRVRYLSLNPVLVRRDGVSVLHASVQYGHSGPRPDSGPRRLSS